jgi:hypothetical protein
MPRPSNAVDFWRGFALVSIFINHIPGIFYERFTHRNLSISDAADLFVFLAGWSLRYLVGRPGRGVPLRDLMFRLGGRAVQLYAAQILLVTVAVAILGSAAVALRNPLLLEWHNAAAVFYDPVATHIGLALLTHHLGFFDILPLYVVLMLMAPLVALIDRWAPRLLLPLSFAIYLTVLVFQINLPSWPVEGQWFFNPLAWQFIFVLGFVLARDDVEAALRPHLPWIRIVAAPVVVLGALMMIFSWWPDPAKVPEPRLLFIAVKQYMTPIRLIQFLALVALFSAAYPHIARAVPPLVDLFSMLGRNSLEVFCVASILSLASQVVRFVYKGNLFVDTIILCVGMLTLAFTAWAAEWRQRRSLQPAAARSS